MTMTFRACAALAFGLLAGAAPLRASDTSFGFQAGMAVPYDALSRITLDSRGLDLGAFALVDFGGGHALRPRLDFTRFHGTRKDDNLVTSGDLAAVVNIGRDFRVSQWTLGGDYLHYLDGDAGRGLYLLGGLGLVLSRFSGELTAFLPQLSTQELRASIRKTALSPHVQVGLGWQITRTIGLEGRYCVFRFNGEDTRYKVQITDFITYSGNYAFGQSDMTAYHLAATVRF